MVAASPEADVKLVRYDSMVHAISECHRVDEVKDIRDKALALEAYAKQAKNTEAERKAADIRLRAERRCGQLLRELARAEAGARRNPNGRRGKKPGSAAVTQAPSPYASALSETGISRQTASRYQSLAEIPEKDFERALADPKQKPSTRRLISRKQTETPQIDDDVLWLWGRCRDFERRGCGDMKPRKIMKELTETMQDDMRRIVPVMADFFQHLAEDIEQ